MADDLKKLLWKDRYDPIDFASVLCDHLGGAQGSVAQTSLGPKDSPAIFLKWTERGRLDAVEPGPSFEWNTVQAIQAALVKALEEGESVVRRFLVTTSRPVQGFYRHQDFFQLMPAPQNAPRPQWPIMAGNPAVLELRLVKSTSESVTSRRSMVALSRIEDLFSALTMENLSRASPRVLKHEWILGKDGNESVFAQTHYSVHGFAHSASGFTEQGGGNPIPFVEPNAYYDDQGSYEEFRLPATIPTLLETYYRLDNRCARKFLRSAHWSRVASEVGSVSKSAAYAAAVQAIEALMPSIDPGPPCEKCGLKPGHKSRVTFAKFVDGLTGGVIAEKDRLEFYNIRSRLVHGDRLLTLDDEFMSLGPVQLAEMGGQRLIKQIALVVSHNWLLERRITD